MDWTEMVWMLVLSGCAGVLSSAGPLTAGLVLVN